MMMNSRPMVIFEYFNMLCMPASVKINPANRENNRYIAASTSAVMTIFRCLLSKSQ